MTNPLRTIRGVTYRRFSEVFPGERLYLITSNVLAIEHWAYEVGQHHFDYEVNSRAVSPQGRPQSIMTTRDALGREFMERKVNTRQVVPVSIGDADGNGIPEVAMTYGEVAPQIYRSRVSTSQVAWSIVFGQHRHVSTQEAARGLAFVTGRKSDPVHHGRTSAKARHLGGGHNYLVIWIPTDQLPQTRTLNDGLGTIDVIGENPPLLRRVINWVSGQ